MNLWNIAAMMGLLLGIPLLALSGRILPTILPPIDRLSRGLFVLLFPWAAWLCFQRGEMEFILLLGILLFVYAAYASMRSEARRLSTRLGLTAILLIGTLSLEGLTWLSHTGRLGDDLQSLMVGLAGRRALPPETPIDAVEVLASETPTVSQQKVKPFPTEIRSLSRAKASLSRPANPVVPQLHSEKRATPERIADYVVSPFSPVAVEVERLKAPAIKGPQSEGMAEPAAVGQKETPPRTPQAGEETPSVAKAGPLPPQSFKEPFRLDRAETLGHAKTIDPARIEPTGGGLPLPADFSKPTVDIRKR